MATNGVNELEREFQELVARAGSAPSVVEVLSIRTQLNHIIGQLEALKPLPGQTAEIDRRVIQLEQNIAALGEKLGETQNQLAEHESQSKERSDMAMLVALFSVLLAVIGTVAGVLSVVDDEAGSPTVTTTEAVSTSTTIQADTTAVPRVTERSACPTSADTEIVYVPAGSEVVGQWVSEEVRVLQCVTPNGQIVYYGWTSVGDILLPARIQDDVLIASNVDTTYRLDRGTGQLEIVQAGSRIASSELQAVE